ncbi:hypothetical protein J005_01464 [Cryptococcus neoformans]|nr:hypothetical protein J005_01464 [Cryptococcus neoformans var. grubii]
MCRILYMVSFERWWGCRETGQSRCTLSTTAGLQRGRGSRWVLPQGWQDILAFKLVQSSLCLASFENLVSTAVKKCLQDDQFVQTKSKPTNNELRGRVVDYLNSVVREKKKAEVKKKTEARMKNVKGRTMRFRAWLISNWKDTPLDGCKERDLFKRALLSERGVLRNLHFLEHNEIEDVLKRVAERRSNSAGDNDDEDDDDVYDEFLLLADAYYGSKVERPTVVVVPCNKSAMLSGLDTKAGYKPKARQNAGQLPSSTCLINTIIRSPWVSASRPVQPAS